MLLYSESKSDRTNFCITLLIIFGIVFWVISLIYLMFIIGTYYSFINSSENNCIFIETIKKCPNLNIVAKLNDKIINILDYYYNIDNCNFNLYLYNNFKNFTCYEVSINDYNKEYYTDNGLTNYYNDFYIKFKIFSFIVAIGFIIFWILECNSYHP